MLYPHPMPRPTAILIAGPTASGKSALALALAERHGGTIINADSMQVYRELRILTARPSPEDEARVPHVLCGHVAGDDGYSAGRFLADATRAIAEARAERRLPILVGGTGLYFKALTEGLSPIPPIPPAIRERWRAEARQIGAAGLFARLAASDPETAARLSPTDAQRLSRALEVLDATGLGLSRWQQQQGLPVLDQRTALCLVAAPERDALYRRAEARFDAMIAAGALAEVAALIAKRYAPDLPIMHALGVRPLARHLAGEVGLEEAVALAKIETRQYIKRQLTWLRRHIIAWKPVDEQQMERIRCDDFALIGN